MRIGLIDVDSWKDINGYEGLYQVNKIGQVKSLKRVTVIHGVETWIQKEKILKPSKDKKGYLIVNLRKDGMPKSFKVHRLVAIAFIGESDKKCVCHKDNNPSNNSVENLYWGSDLDNQRQAWADGLHKNTVSVYSIDAKGAKTEYKSQSKASRTTGVSQANIWKCCVGERKTAGGFRWVKK